MSVPVTPCLVNSLNGVDVMIIDRVDSRAIILVSVYGFDSYDL